MARRGAGLFVGEVCQVPGTSIIRRPSLLGKPAAAPDESRLALLGEPGGTTLMYSAFPLDSLGGLLVAAAVAPLIGAGLWLFAKRVKWM